MSDNKEKLSPEKLNQIKQLQKMLAQQQSKGGKDMPPNFPAGSMGAQKPPQKWSAKGMFLSFLQFLNNKVQLVDQFVNLVTNKESDTTNDVVHNARSPILFGTFVIFFFVIKKIQP